MSYPFGHYSPFGDFLMKVFVILGALVLGAVTIGVAMDNIFIAVVPAIPCFVLSMMAWSFLSASRNEK